MIIISYKELKTEEDSNNLDITYNSNKDNRTINYLNPENEIENKNSTQRIIFNANKNISRLNIIRNNISKIKNNSQTKKIIFIIIGIILALIIIGIIIYIKTRKTTKEKITYLNEDLIIKKNYPVNRLFRYSSIQKNEIKIEGKDISANNNSFETSQLIDFIFIVREKNIEIEQTSKTKKTQKEWYTGYIGFLNITIVNETHNMLSLYDKSLFENINTKNLRYLDNIDKTKDKINVNYVDKENNICFSKIDFYQNGEIKKYFLPKNFSIYNFNYIEQAAKLLIPKISANLFKKKINETLNELIEKNRTDLNDDNINDEDEEEEEYEFDFNDDFDDNITLFDTEENYRLLSSEINSTPTKKVEISKGNKRKLSNTDINYINLNNNNTLNYTELENIRVE